jgi:TolA-binding protein
MRTNLLQIPTSAALLIAALAAPLSAQRIKDTLVKVDGSRVRGVEVTAATATQVTLKRGDQDESVPAGEVHEIEWHDPPVTFTDADAAILRGDFAKAATLFKEASDGAERGLLKRDALFRAGQALLEAASAEPDKAAQAAGVFQDYLTAAPDGFRVPAARLGIARALVLQGKGSEAEAALTQLEQDAVANVWGFYWDAMAKYERARAQIAQNKHGDARSTFRAVVSAVEAALAAKGSDPRLETLKGRAAVSEGETYVAEKNYDGALQFYRRLASSSDPALQAAGLAGEGQCLFLQAEPAKDVANLRAAQLALARANLLDTTAGDTSAKALFYTGKVLLALGDAKALAEGYFDTVARHYTQTPWAEQARAALGR